MARKYIQGIFKPKNPEKYKGDVSKIIYRSSWELKVMIEYDSDPKVLKWSSEEHIINYRDYTGKARRYFMDFWVRREVGEDIIEQLVEVKPFAQTQPPKPPKKKTKRAIQEAITYDTNLRKWDAARKFCARQNMEFVILTENQLGIPKK